MVESNEKKNLFNFLLFILIGIGCGVSMVCLGIYLQYKYYLDNHDPQLPAQYTWFPVVCIFSFTICCCVGYLVVPWVMIGELYPQKVRGLVGGMTTFAAHSFVFIVVKTYPMLSHTLQQHGTFILYGVISLTGQYTHKQKLTIHMIMLAKIFVIRKQLTPWQQQPGLYFLIP